MAWFPISHTVPQYVDTNGDPFSGSVLKAYTAGTSTNISLATDSTGGTTASSIALNANGYPEVSSSIVIPHVNEKYKLSLFPTQAAADANTGATWTIDNIGIGSDFGSTTEVISASTALDSSDAFTHKEISGTSTIDLPTPGFTFTARNAGVALVTFDPDGSETINGSATLIFYPGDAGLFQYDTVNSTWSVNVGSELGIGTSGQILGTNGTARTWQGNTLGDSSDVIITSAAAADIIMRNVANNAWINVASADRFFVGTYSRDISSVGAQSVTGVGFKPSFLFQFGGTSGVGVMSFGITDGSTTRNMYDNSASTPNTWLTNTNLGIYQASGGNFASLAFTSFDSDGFTVTWSKTLSPTGTATINFIAIR